MILLRIHSMLSDSTHRKTKDHIKSSSPQFASAVHDSFRIQIYHIFGMVLNMGTVSRNTPNNNKHSHNQTAAAGKLKDGSNNPTDVEHHHHQASNRKRRSRTVEHYNGIVDHLTRNYSSSNVPGLLAASNRTPQNLSPSLDENSSSTLFPATTSGCSDYTSVNEPAGSDNNNNNRTNEEVIRVAVIGDKAVGKTSIIQQALFTEYHGTHQVTVSAGCYRVTMFSDDRLLRVLLIDTPRFEENDQNPQIDWVKQHCYQKCALFVLVYDVTRDDSFSYVKYIHNEIAKWLDSNAFSVIIIGNKVDLLINSSISSLLGGSGGAGVHVNAIGNSNNNYYSAYPSSSSNLAGMSINHQAAASSRNGAHRQPTTKPEIANFSRRVMRANYIECSAKYYWNVIFLLKEIARMLQDNEEQRVVKNSSNKTTNKFSRRQCTLS